MITHLVKRERKNTVSARISVPIQRNVIRRTQLNSLSAECTA